MKYSENDFDIFYGNEMVSIVNTDPRYHWNPETFLADIPGYEIELPGQDHVYEHDRKTLWVYEGELSKLPLWKRLDRIEKTLGLTDED